MRGWLVVLCLVVLSGCTPRLLNDPAAAALVVRSVQVDTSAIVGIKGRKMAFDMAPAQIDADLTALLQMKLGATPTGNADVIVRVSTVRLMSRMQELALGGASYVQGDIMVRDAKTGRLIVAPTKVIGTSQRFRMGGVIGAMAAPTAEKDYRQTLDGFATNVLIRLSPRHAMVVDPASPAAKAGRAQTAAAKPNP